VPQIKPPQSAARFSAGISASPKSGRAVSACWLPVSRPSGCVGGGSPVREVMCGGTLTSA
jgi:hypothetical protein